MKEIIFLSFGNYSNFVLSHFWNLNVHNLIVTFQDEVLKNEKNPFNLNHDLIYDDAQRPRTLLFDYSENIRPYYQTNDKMEDNDIQAIQDQIEINEDGGVQIFNVKAKESNFVSMMNELSMQKLMQMEQK